MHPSFGKSDNACGNKIMYGEHILWCAYSKNKNCYSYFETVSSFHDYYLKLKINSLWDVRCYSYKLLSVNIVIGI